MVVKDEVIPLLLGACPSLRERWKVYLDPRDDDPLLYADLAEVAAHVLELLSTGATAELSDLFDVVERLHIDGDPYVQEAATIGLLESVQHLAGWQGVDPEIVRRHLKPESARWWGELDRFWSGTSPYVGAPDPEA